MWPLGDACPSLSLSLSLAGVCEISRRGWTPCSRTELKQSSRTGASQVEKKLGRDT